MLGHGLAHGLERRDRVEGVPRQQRLGARARERRRSGEHLVQHTAQAVEIAATVDMSGARLLRTHVGGRPDRHPAFRQLLPPGARDRQGESEVRHDRMFAAEQDVLRLDVPMHNALTVGATESAANITRDAEGVVERKRAFPCQALA